MGKKSVRVFALMLAALLSCVAPVGGQDASGPRPKRQRTPDDYKPRTLKEVAAERPGEEGRGNKAETMHVLADILPSRVRAKYAGSSRPLPQIKTEVVRQWALRYAGAPESFTGPYETEMLFEEGGTKYWLAVKRRAALFFERELKRGDEVDLYLIRLGAAKGAGGWEPVFLIESVRKPN